MWILGSFVTLPSYCVAWPTGSYVHMRIWTIITLDATGLRFTVRADHAVSASASWLLVTYIIHKSLTLYTIITLYIRIQAYRVHSCVSLLVIIHVLLHSCEYANMRIIHHCYLFIFTHIIARSALIIIIAHIYCLLLLLSYHEYHEIYMLLCLFHFLITNHSFWSFLFIFSQS